jgi:5'-phosphate synthase pdxT subunit
MARIGVLAVQGAFAAHARVLTALQHQPVLVTAPRDLERLEGLVLPGGESTVQLALIARFGLEAPLRALVQRGLPVLATCAGLILAARRVCLPEQASFGWIDVSVQRNGYGRQLDSFEAESDALHLPLVFIRAPRILELGPGVEVLDYYAGEPVLVRELNLTCATFHPELSGDVRVHEQVFGSAGVTRPVHQYQSQLSSQIVN